MPLTRRKASPEMTLNEFLKSDPEIASMSVFKVFKQSRYHHQVESEGMMYENYLTEKEAIQLAKRLTETRGNKVLKSLKKLNRLGMKDADVELCGDVLTVSKNKSKYTFRNVWVTLHTDREENK